MKKSKQVTESDEVAVLRLKRSNTLEQVSRLESLASALRSDANLVHSRDLMHLFLKQAESCELKRVAIADAFHMSEATISRWIAGEVRPHQILARASLEELARLALAEAAKLRKFANELRETA